MSRAFARCNGEIGVGFLVRSLVGKALFSCVIEPSLQGGPDRLFRAIGNGEIKPPGSSQNSGHGCFHSSRLAGFNSRFRDRSPTVHYTLAVYTLRRPPQPRRLPGCSLYHAEVCNAMPANRSFRPFHTSSHGAQCPQRMGFFFIENCIVQLLRFVYVARIFPR